MVINRKTISMLFTLLVVSIALILLFALPHQTPKTTIIRGMVISDTGPVKGAVVRVQSASYYTVTDEAGHFTTSVLDSILPETYLTAWAPNYLIGWAEDIVDQDNVIITLTPHYTTDNPDYDWFSHEGDPGSLSCAHCMPSCAEWVLDAHSQSAINPRFLSLYNGTALTGVQGQETVYRFDAELGIDVPVAPSQGMDRVGPGFRLDYPELGGNCATCHVPEAAAHPGDAYININTVSGVALEGVFCEFCHKIGEVYLRPETGLPDASKPGVLSMRLYRPEEGQQVFFGNFDDVTGGRRVTYLPLIKESAYCAACHFGEFWGVIMYNSFGEWLESPYSDPETGQTCQDCHMPAVDYNYFVFPEKGGQYRDSGRILSHLMPGAMDETLLQNTATVTIDAQRLEDRLQVTIRVTNTGAGHHIPTDNPLRNMILLVEATDADGETLPLLDGPIIPEWGGVGDVETGHVAGLPGVLYAKVLADFYTGETPTFAYWRQTRLVSDNRIAALETDETLYSFALPEGNGTITIDAQLLLRRAFINLMDVKDWDTPDMLMAQVHETVGD
jgi:hypothetical protein